MTNRPSLTPDLDKHFIGGNLRQTASEGGVKNQGRSIAKLAEKLPYAALIASNLVGVEHEHRKAS
jgi:hypothetical protein